MLFFQLIRGGAALLAGNATGIATGMPGKWGSPQERGDQTPWPSPALLVLLLPEQHPPGMQPFLIIHCFLLNLFFVSRLLGDSSG